MLAIDGLLDRPREWAEEAHHEVDQRPADDDVVVSSDHEGSQDRGHADTSQAGVDATEHTDITTLEVLTQSHLHQGDRQTNEEEADEVRHKEGGSTPLEAQIREAPEVAKADAVANHSQDERHAAEPARTVLLSVFLVFEALVAVRFDTHEYYRSGFLIDYKC